MPGAFPLVGHLPAIVFDLPELLDRAGRDFGPLFWLDFGFTGLELACLLPDSSTLLCNRVTTLTLLEELAPDIFGNALMAQDGERHRSIRRMMDGPFQFGGLTATGLGQDFAAMIEQKLLRWREAREVLVVKKTGNLVLSLLFHLMGIEESAFSAWQQSYVRFTALMIAPPIDPPGLPRPRGRRARAWIDHRLHGFIEAARRQPGAPGFLAAVVRAAGASGTLTEAHLISSLRFMILAGHETTAATMAWVVVELATRPDVWDRLCAEANEVACTPRNPR